MVNIFFGLAALGSLRMTDDGEGGKPKLAEREEKDEGRGPASSVLGPQFRVPSLF